MKRKIIALLLCIVCVVSLCFPVAADDDGYSAIVSDIDKTCPTCGATLHASWCSTSGAEVELEISDTGKVKIPAGAGAFARIHLRCSSCGYEKTETRLLGLDFGAEKPGKLVQAPSGIGRKDLPGYADDDGTPSVSSDGGIIWQPTWDDVLDCNFNLNFDSRYYGGGTEYNLQKMKNGSYNTSTSTSIKSFVFSGTQLTVSWNYTDFSYASNGVFSDSSSVKGIFKFKTPIRGYYSKLKTPRLYFKAGNETLYYPADTKSTLYDVDSILSFPGMLGAGYFTNEVSSSHHVWQFYMPQYKIIPFDSADKPTSFTNITINNNTWNGNIYTDNSTNLTYIYPQYTTVNEKNETVTNISNTPIIYNNETKKYYTYDTVTNNYYYITYEQPVDPTPSPSPSPAPTETPSPSPSPSPSPAPLAPVLPETQNLIIPKMNSNTFTDEHGTWIASGSSKYSDVFDFFRAFDRSTSEIWETNVSPSHLQIEIPDPGNYYIDGYIMRISKFDNRYAKDWTLQGSDDGKTWDDLDTQKDQNLSDKEEHKYSLTLRKAYKYYRLNMSNYASSMCSLSHFNLLGYDAKDVVTPTPAPTDPPSPSPAPDPGKPGGSSGSSWWDKLLSKIGDAIIDGLLGAVSAVLKLIFKLFSTILSWIIWAVSRVFDLLPFLPPGLGGLLVGGVVVCFVIGIIKFIRG